MAHSNSANKRIRQNAKRRARNRWRKNSFRDAIKEYRDTLAHGAVDAAEKQLVGLYRLLDKVAATGTIHKKTASRYKGRLSIALNKRKAGGTPVAAA